MQEHLKINILNFKWLSSTPTDGYPFPIKIKMSSLDEDAFEDVEVTEELLTQVYQFSRMYWKSLRLQNVPITIKYPEMIVQIAPSFNNGISEYAKDKLWFLKKYY